MGSAAVGDFSAVPVVDIGPLAASSGARRTATELGRACRDVGFFYIVGHGVSEKLQQRLERLSRTFFAQDVAATAYTDTDAPAFGDAFFYMVRARNACGPGGWGLPADGGARTSTCP